MAGLAHAVRNQFAAALFRNGNKGLFKAVVVDKREIHVVELHAADFLELFFDAAAHFQRKGEYFADFFLAKISVRIEQLQHAGNHLAHGDRIALVEVAAEFEILVQRITE